MIRGIIFDLGGVLVDLDLEICRSNFISILGYTKIDEILDACHQKGIYGSLEEGRLSEEEFKAEILKDSFPGGTGADVDKCMYSLLASMPTYKAELLKSLAQDYPLYLLSNNNPIAMRRSVEIFSAYGLDFNTLFKKLFLSYQMKMLKPGAAIYKEVIGNLEGDPSEYIFIDDSLANVEAASELGFIALHYVIGDDLVQLVRSGLASVNESDARVYDAVELPSGTEIGGQN